jgi:NAD(P)-dependent dehydrogenase (short-subunit alcohol dehydrogenase family)
VSTSRILVTGGASGIGAAIARHWSNLGHDITITDVNDNDGRALATELGCTYVHLDVRDESEWRTFATANGAFDVVFLNAGVATGDLIFGNPDTSPFTSFDLAAYRRTLGVNVDGVVFGVAHLAPAMVARGSGDIVVTASMASIYPIPPDPIYGLSKHAVSGFVKSLAPALYERGVCLSAICPFFVDTPLVPKEQQAQIRETGFDVLTVDRVVEAAQMAIAEPTPGAHWVVFPGQPINRLPEPTLG